MVVIEPDRRQAITKAVNEAADGDVILVAGKGHEAYIEARGHKTPFSDRDEAVAEMHSTRDGRGRARRVELDDQPHGVGGDGPVDRGDWPRRGSSAG